MWKFFKYLFVLMLITTFLGVAGVAGGLYYLVVVEPGPEVEAEYIKGILGRESPVFYRDGEAKLGVLFEDVHRRYLTYENIPRHFVNAIVASEDDKFFSHYGIDVPGIVRAMIANIRAGRVVQGGSTITQQTAKNLFKRHSRSYKAKLKELLFALRLEYKYPKEKILEFYSNQFFVSGNGHGLGVAAHYYFSKAPNELNLLECAYIAGSVKRPNYYNPFTRRNQANPEASEKKVEERVGYVLGRMLKNGMISQADYDQAKTEKIIFSKGKMAYRLNTTMDLVKDGLESPVIRKALEDAGIYNVSTSGIRVITSVEKEVQHRTLKALRRHLSTLDVRLSGYDREEVQDEYAQLTYVGDTEYHPGSFVFGRISEIVEGGESGRQIVIVFDDEKTRGVLTPEGMERVVAALAKFKRKRWSEPKKSDRRYLMEQFKVGDRIYVALKDKLEKGEFAVELERYPKVDGGVMALQQGGIRAMAGGMTDRYYNRAIDAKRLMGSTFKPFLFAAALQLGWSPVDLLDNRRDVFIFMDRPYFPRPDHTSLHDLVTMSWAGVQSENVAAVRLLYHLTDHLTPPRLREVAAHLDMAPRVDGDIVEGYGAFKQRIRDGFGILITRSALRKAAFDEAKKALRADFLFDRRMKEYEQIQKLHYGLNFDRFIEDVEAAQKDDSLEPYEKKELKLRKELLGGSYLSLGAVREAFGRFRSYIDEELREENDFFYRKRSPLFPPPEGTMVLRNGREVVFTLNKDLPEGWRVWPFAQVMSYINTLNSAQYERFWASVELEGRITVDAYDQLVEQVEMERNKLSSLRPYSLEMLGKIRDYRVMLGLQYLVRLGRECGITSSLEPVLSFPLGSNVVSLLEAVRMYETLVTGKRFELLESAQPVHEGLEEDQSMRDGRSVIERIEAPDGEVIYQRQMVARRVFDRKTTAAVVSILQNTVSYGTGRYARNNVRLHSSKEEREEELAALALPLPLLGKTGTANNYRNASFLGFVPVTAPGNETVLSVEGGFALGVYAGYDDNIPMRKGTTRVTGSLGALPAWSETAEALLEDEEVGDNLDLIDLTFNGLQLRYPEVKQVFVPVDPKQGGRPRGNGGVRRQQVSTTSPSSLAYGKYVSGHFEPERQFHPYWNN